MLTHLPLVPHIYVSESGQHWFRQWLVAYSAPSQYLNKWRFIVNWTLRNKLQWNFNQDTKFFIHKNASENIVCEKATILSSGRYVKAIACGGLPFPSTGCTVPDVANIYLTCNVQCMGYCFYNFPPPKDVSAHKLSLQKQIGLVSMDLFYAIFTYHTQAIFRANVDLDTWGPFY